MKRILCAAVLLGLVACQQAVPVVTDACKVVATISTTAEGATLAAQDPHSAAGVLWADLRSACVNGAPDPAVKTDWVAIVVKGLETAAPYILPLIAAL